MSARSLQFNRQHAPQADTLFCWRTPAAGARVPAGSSGPMWREEIRDAVPPVKSFRDAGEKNCRINKPRNQKIGNGKSR